MSACHECRTEQPLFADIVTKEREVKFVTIEMLGNVKRHYDSLVERDCISIEAKLIVLEVLCRCRATIESTGKGISIETAKKLFPTGSLRASEGDAIGLSSLRKFKDEAALVICAGLNLGTEGEIFRKKDLRSR